MSPDELERSFAAAFGLLGELASRGPDARTLALARALPGLREALPEGDALLSLQVAHQRAFGFEVPPWAGAFLSEDGQVGGEATLATAALLQAHGLRLPVAGEGPEQLGVLLSLVAELLQRAVDSRPADPRGAARLVDAATRLTAERLLPWLPPLVAAVRRVDRGLPRAIVDLAWGLGLALHARGGEGADPPSPLGRGAPDLGHADTSTRDIAAYLTAPSRCGIFFGRSAWGGAAYALGVPASLGSRADMARDLLLTAADHDRFAPLVDALRGEAAQALAEYDALAADPGGAPWVRPWRGRAEETDAFFIELGARVAGEAAASASPPPGAGAPAGPGGPPWD